MRQILKDIILINILVYSILATMFFVLTGILIDNMKNVVDIEYPITNNISHYTLTHDAYNNFRNTFKLNKSVIFYKGCRISELSSLLYIDNKFAFGLNNNYIVNHNNQILYTYENHEQHKYIRIYDKTNQIFIFYNDDYNRLLAIDKYNVIAIMNKYYDNDIYYNITIYNQSNLSNILVYGLIISNLYFLNHSDICNLYYEPIYITSIICILTSILGISIIISYYTYLLWWRNRQVSLFLSQVV